MTASASAQSGVPSRQSFGVPAVSTVGDVDAARVELGRLYLEAFGPATLDDFAWWSGFTKTIAKQAFEELFGEVPANKDVVDAPNPPRARAARGDPLRLLPPWDTYLVAYKDRSRYADDEHLPWVYDKRGNAAPVVMHEGRAAGLWQFDGEQRDVQRVVGGRAQVVLPRPRQGVAGAILVGDAPHLADAGGVEMGGQRELAESGHARIIRLHRERLLRGVRPGRRRGLVQRVVVDRHRRRIYVSPRARCGGRSRRARGR